MSPWAGGPTALRTAPYSTLAVRGGRRGERVCGVRRLKKLWRTTRKLCNIQISRWQGKAAPTLYRAQRTREARTRRLGWTTRGPAVCYWGTNES